MPEFAANRLPMTTSSDQQFIEQIARNPGDTKLRLVYADWLEEHGDVRGEFIRNCQAADAASRWSEEYLWLTEKRELLRLSVDSNWASKLGYGIQYRPLFERIPGSPHERLQLMREFAGFWIPARSGYSETQLLEFESRLGIVLPLIFREWCLHFIVTLESFYTGFFELSRMSIVNGLLEIGASPYGSPTYRIGLTGDDPYVCYAHGQECVSTNERVSTFLIKLLFAQKPLQAITQDWNTATPNEFTYNEEISRKLVRCHWHQEWEYEKWEFFEGRDIFATISGDTHISLAYRNKSALDIFSPAFLADLNSFSNPSRPVE